MSERVWRNAADEWHRPFAATATSSTTVTSSRAPPGCAPNSDASAHARVIRANGAWPSYRAPLALAQI